MNTPSNRSTAPSRFGRASLIGAALMGLAPGGAKAETKQGGVESTRPNIMLSPNDYVRAQASLASCKSSKLSDDLTRFTNELVLEALCADGSDKSCLALEGVDKTVALKASNVPKLSADVVDACLEGRFMDVKPKKPKGKAKPGVQSLIIEQTDMNVAKCLHDALNGKLPTFTPVLTPKSSSQPNVATPLPGIRVGASAVPPKDVVIIDVQPGYGGSRSTTSQPQTDTNPVDATGVVSELEKCVSYAEKSKYGIRIVEKARRILDWSMKRRKSVVSTDALDELRGAEEQKRAEQEKVLDLIQRGIELGPKASATSKGAYDGVNVR